MAHIVYHDAPIERIDQSQDWLPVSPQVIALGQPVSRRSDLVATVGPGAAHGNPACYIPSRGEIRIDTDVCLPPGMLPGAVDLKDELFRLQHAEFVGTIFHENSHAAHTRWLAPDLVALGASPRQVDIVIALEEARIEGLAVKERPRTRIFLRASAVGLILKDFSIGDSVYGASVSAALLLARADAGVLEQDDVAAVHEQVQAILGHSRLSLLRPLWQSALDLPDRNLEGAVDLASRWLQVLGPEAEDEPLAAEGLAAPVGGSGSAAVPDWLARSAGSIAVAADTAVSRKRMGERIRREREAAAADADRRHQGAPAREAAFAPPDGMESMGRYVSSREPYRRPPTAGERSAATALAAALLQARSADGELVRDDRPSPPGRLNTRSLVRSIASGSDDPVPDLFRHSRPAAGPDEHLTVCLMVDISGSMVTAAEPMASSQWVVSRAASAVGARVAVVHFGVRAYGVQRSWTMNDTVDIYECGDGFESFRDAFLTIDAEAELLDSPGARLLVIASDARYGRTGEAEYAEKAMTMCRQKGVSVLWLDFTGAHRTTYGHGTVVKVRGDSPAKIVERISAAIMATQMNI